MNFAAALSGHFYAVGIGPGAADLLTVRAVNLIKSADVIIAPRSEVSSSSLALNTIKDYLQDGQDVLEREYPMKRDSSATSAFWGSVAREVEDFSRVGRSVVQITLGDPLIYSTSSYLLDALVGSIDESRIHIIPGVSSLQASAAKFSEVLTIQEDRMTLMTATDLDEVGKALDCCETLVLYKAGKKLDQLRELLADRGMLENARAAFYVEQEDEAIWHNMAEEFDYDGRYMTTVIIQKSRRKWDESL